jgi:hypothetical protein
MARRLDESNWRPMHTHIAVALALQVEDVIDLRQPQAKAFARRMNRTISMSLPVNRR